MTILRSLWPAVMVVLLLWITAPETQSREFRIQRTELFPPSVTTAVSPNGHTIAIARSSGSIEKRNGRVELWDSTSGADFRETRFNSHISRFFA